MIFYEDLQPDFYYLNDDSSELLFQDKFEYCPPDFENVSTINLKEKIDDAGDCEKDYIENELENNNKISPISPIENKYGPNIIQILEINKSIDELRAQIKGSGIGTSATRAGILTKLVNIGYLNLNKKNWRNHK